MSQINPENQPYAIEKRLSALGLPELQLDRQVHQSREYKEYKGADWEPIVRLNDAERLTAKDVESTSRAKFALAS